MNWPGQREAGKARVGWSRMGKGRKGGPLLGKMMRTDAAGQRGRMKRKLFIPKKKRKEKKKDR